jgi:dephospho-CoA kinase
MKKIGVTGGIGSGKTMVCRILEHIGYPIFYADLEAKQLMLENIELKKSIYTLLGDQSYIQNELNKPYISEQLFKNPTIREALNNLVHPAVFQAFETWSLLQKSNLVFNESALLFETNSFNRFDKTIVVTASLNTRIKRVKLRDQLTEENITQRIQAQLEDEEKIKLADFVINNNENQLIIPQILEIVNQL